MEAERDTSLAHLAISQWGSSRRATFSTSRAYRERSSPYCNNGCYSQAAQPLRCTATAELGSEYLEVPRVRVEKTGAVRIKKALTLRIARALNVGIAHMSSPPH